MATLFISHEVDDVERWLAAPTREQFFGPMGITLRTFRDPEGSNRVGLLAEVPDVDALKAALATEAAAEAMRTDGVRPETIVILAEG